MIIFLKALFIVIEVICCLLLTGLILLQRSKSEGLGLAFGASAGESLFGARAGNVLSKATVVLGITFMASTLVLGVLYAKQEASLMDSAGDVTVPAASATIQPLPVEGLDLGAPPIEAESESAPVESGDAM